MKISVAKYLTILQKLIIFLVQGVGKKEKGCVIQLLVDLISIINRSANQ